MTVLRHGRRARWTGDRGSAVVEMLPMTLVMFAFVALVVFVGRLNVAYAHVEGAARSAARMVSLDRDPGSAAATAAAEAHAAGLVDAGTSMCTSMGLSVSVVTDATVTVELTCEVDLSSAALIGVPGSATVTATAVEPIDRHRETAP